MSKSSPQPPVPKAKNRAFTPEIACLGMAKKLILMRHAQAESRSGCSDHERKLSAFGRQQAKAAGLALRDDSIEMVMCSDAARTRDTLDQLDLPNNPHVEYMRALYLCSVETLRQRISEVPDEISTLLIVAHAPSIPHLAAELSWAQDPRKADALTCAYPTANFSKFEVSGTWQELGEAKPGDKITRPLN